jgi:hypothetical protein
MKRTFFLALWILTMWGGESSVKAIQTGTSADAMKTLVPREEGPWVMESDEVYDAETIFEYIDGAGEVYRSYNMKLLLSRRFRREEGPDLVVDLFDMGSPEDAYGVFTHDLDGEAAGIGQESNYKAGLLSFWKGRYFGSVFAEEESPEAREAVLGLGRRISDSILDEGGKPGLVEALPEKGLVSGEVRFFHLHAILNYHFFVADRNALLLGPTTDAVLAPYVDESGKSRLLVVRYAEAKTAADALDSFCRAYMPDAPERGTVRTEDGTWTSVRLFGDTLAIVFDAGSRESAEDRLAAVGTSIRSLRAAPPEGQR